MNRASAPSATHPRSFVTENLAIREFLDCLAEMLADSILEACAEGTPVDFQNASSTSVAPEEDA